MRILLIPLLVAAGLPAADHRPADTDPRPLFTIVVAEAPGELARRHQAGDGGAYWSAFAAYGGRLAASGHLVGGAALRHPVADGPDAMRVVARHPGVPVPDLGGSFVVRARDLDEAAALAADCPAAATGTVTVHAHVPMMPPATP